MKPSTFVTKALLAAVLATTALFVNACNSDTQNIRFGSGNKGGTYDKFANSFAEQFNNKNSGTGIQVKNTAGTSANIRLLEENFLDIAIVQADILQDYLMRSRMRHAITAVAGLYTESIQVVVSANSDIRTIADLTGKKVAVGEEESGVLRNAEIILEAYGIPFDKIQPKYLNFKESATALKAGEIDAFFCTAGIPTPSISELAASKGIRILSLDSADATRIMSLHPELTSSDIPAGTYAGQDSTVQTLGAKAVLVANQLVDDAPISQIMEELFANGSSKLEGFSTPSIGFVTSNIPVGFHPAAVKFYASKNIIVSPAAPLQGRGPTPSTGD
ncbi:MAG: TAXI family TRAP transporter solute-binding subunit [Fibrobacter sp.]|nr:TAXI family TRAP transporter solute-binding subunit [Fibrobacter sp.]